MNLSRDLCGLIFLVCISRRALMCSHPKKDQYVTLEFDCYNSKTLLLSYKYVIYLSLIN